jgi:hypothetical protein
MLGLFRRMTMVAALVAALVTITACEKSESWKTATDQNVAKMEEGNKSFGGFYTQMADNAILRDMSLTDSHFVAHSAEISGLGVARLERMAKLLTTYGGTVRYQTDSRDEKLVKQRLDHVREYLKLTGCNMERVAVAAALPGGKGMPGDEAMAKLKQGTARPQQGGGGTTISIGGPGGGSGGGQ